MRRRIGEDLLLEYIQQTVKFGGGSVMVWGCISCEGTGAITKVEGRMNMAKTTLDYYLDTCFPTCSQWDLVMCLWMTMPHAINIRQ